MLRRHRFSADDLDVAQGFWQQQLQDALDEFPMSWATPIWPATEEVP